MFTNQISEIDDGEWLQFLLKAPISNYKLHLAVGLEHYAEKLPALRKELNAALAEETIQGFKFLKQTDYAKNSEIIRKINDDSIYLNKVLQNLKSKLKIEKNAEKIAKIKKDITLTTQYLSDNNESLFTTVRLFHNPVTIYLQVNSDPQKTGQLCYALEKILADLALQTDKLSSADLPLLPHISFRQVSLSNENKYFEILQHSSEQIEILKQQALSSDVYRALQAEFSKEVISNNNFNQP